MGRTLHTAAHHRRGGRPRPPAFPGCSPGFAAHISAAPKYNPQSPPSAATAPFQRSLFRLRAGRESGRPRGAAPTKSASRRGVLPLCVGAHIVRPREKRATPDGRSHTRWCGGCGTRPLGRVIGKDLDTEGDDPPRAAGPTCAITQVLPSLPAGAQCAPLQRPPLRDAGTGQQAAEGGGPYTRWEHHRRAGACPRRPPSPVPRPAAAAKGSFGKELSAVRRTEDCILPQAKCTK